MVRDHMVRMCCYDDHHCSCDIHIAREVMKRLGADSFATVSPVTARTVSKLPTTEAHLIVLWCSMSRSQAPVSRVQPLTSMLCRMGKRCSSEDSCASRIVRAGRRCVSTRPLTVSSNCSQSIWLDNLSSIGKQATSLKEQCRSTSNLSSRGEASDRI
jgi:hypothetical protein